MTQLPVHGTVFQTLEQFKSAAQSAAKQLGYAFSVSSSNKNGKNNRQPYVVLQCTMGGAYKNSHNLTEETRKQVRLSKRQHCPVKLRAMYCEGKGWVMNDPLGNSATMAHTHDLLPETKVHCLPQHRQVSDDHRQLIITMVKSGAPAKAIADAVNSSNGSATQKI